MNKPWKEHLVEADFDLLVKSPGDPRLQNPNHSDDRVQELWSHIESCSACHARLTSYRSAQSDIVRMSTLDKLPPSQDCPESNCWMDVVSGALPAPQTAALLEHAALCRHCGPILKDAAALLSQETTLEEEQLLSQLESRGRDHNRELARTLGRVAHEQSSRGQRTSWWKGLFSQTHPVFGAALASGVLVLAMIGFYLLRGVVHRDSADQLLAQAYTEHRTLELRVPDGKPSPIQVERGGQSSSLDKPQSLLKAEALIVAGLKASPSSPEWLDLKARADLIERNYEPAIKDLQRALEDNPDSVKLLTDLASGYFERAESTNHPIDYGNAVEVLSKVLLASPNDPIALYNRAVTSERMFLYSQAIDDYEHYLRVDPQGEWANDVRSRLAALKEKIQQHEKSEIRPLLEPGEVAAATPEDGPLMDQINGRLEEYLQEAVSDWLPRAYQAHTQGDKGNSSIRRALTVLSQLSVSRHNDYWIADLLSGSNSETFAQAVQELAKALKSNEIGDDDAASGHAHESERLFLLAANEAGAIRARVEYLFSFHEAQQGEPCLQAANGLQKRFERANYPWVFAQFQLEFGTCYWLTGNLGQAQRFYEKAQQVAETARYPVINLRAQDHLASFSAETGDETISAARAEVALAAFWTGSYPPMRGYNLYYDLYESSRLTNRPHLQMAVWRDGLHLSEALSDLTLRAWAHSSMADAALSAGYPTMAKSELETARRLFIAAPPTKATRIAVGETEIRLADVELSLGLAQQAQSRLKSYQAEVSQLSDAFLGIYFDTVMGAAEAQTGDSKNAENHLRSAIDLSNLQMRSLRSDKPRIDWEKRSSDAYRYLAQLQMTQGQVVQALSVWEAYRDSTAQRNEAIRRKSIDGPGLLNSPDRIEAALTDLRDETVISYALLPRGLAIWVLDDRGIFGQFYSQRSVEIKPLLHRFRNLCSNPASDLAEVRATGQTLYALLIAPIENRLTPGRSLVIELDEPLAGIPMEALVDFQGRYLNDRVTVSYSTGLYQRYRHSNLQTISFDSKILAVGVPTSSTIRGPRLAPLPDVASEAESVARRFHSATALLGDDARVASITSRMPSVAIFHFAGHAFSSNAQSGLVFSDGLLGAADVEGRSWPNLKLAVFSACDTQNDFSGGSRAYESLVRSFLHAGAANVVASDWDIDSTATRQFMDFFYASLLKGNTVSTALHAAEIAMRSIPGRAHPYYWSAFAAFA